MELWRQRPDGALVMAILLFVLAVGWVFSLPIRAEHTDLVSSRGYYQDASAQETIASVQSRSFTPFNGPLALGNQLRPLWLKIDVKSAPEGSWVLMVQPNFTQHIEVWQPSGSGQWQSSVTGVNHPYDQRAINTLAPTVPVTLSAESPTTLYLKIVTPTTPAFVRVISAQEAMAFNTLVHLVLGLLLGVGLLTAVISFLLHRATHEPLWLKDSLFNVLGIVTLMLQMGLAAKAIAPMAGVGMGKTVTIMNAVYTSYAIYFYTQIFRLYQLPKRIYWLYWMVLAALPGILVLIGLGHDDVAMLINNALIFVCTLYAYVVMFCAQHEDSLMLWAFRLGYGISNTMYLLSFGVPVVFHQESSSMMSLYPSLPVTVFTVFMLMVILARHTQLKVLENRNLAREKQTAEQQLQAALKHHDETSSFLGMLLHEVKNPLSTIRMSAANLTFDLASAQPEIQQRVERVKQAAESIDDVLERGIEIDQFVQTASKPSLKTTSAPKWLSSVVSKHPESARLRLFQPETMDVSMDHQLTELMVVNLIDNAAKYAQPDTPIVIELSKQGQQWRLSVANKVGPVGFPDENQLFTKYYRSPQAMNLGGLGLGLYWVRGVARQLGGDVRYKAQQDQVVFTLCLPI